MRSSGEPENGQWMDCEGIRKFQEPYQFFSPWGNTPATTRLARGAFRDLHPIPKQDPLETGSPDIDLDEQMHEP